jgi:glycosyltransferase involved in cell wall biosynthesis
MPRNLRVTVLCHNPPVLRCGFVYDEFLGIAPAFGERYGDVPAGFIIYPSWAIGSRSIALAAAAAAHRERFRNHHLLFTCNTQREADLVNLAGQPAVFLNQNLTVSEMIFRPLSDATVDFDAIYNARFSLFKRHQLAAKIDRVAYLSYTHNTDADQQRKQLAAALAQSRSHMLLNPLADGLPVRLSRVEVNAALNRAAVGLCLSEVEGANYASMEYMLAGLPVVSTPSQGGRDVYFDPDYCLICEPNAAAVGDAVKTIRTRKLSREYIRARTLAKIEPDRQQFLMLVDDMITSLGGRRRLGVKWDETIGVAPYDSPANHLLAFERLMSAPGTKRTSQS